MPGLYSLATLAITTSIASAVELRWDWETEGSGRWNREEEAEPYSAERDDPSEYAGLFGLMW